MGTGNTNANVDPTGSKSAVIAVGGSASSINWDQDIAGLQDLSMTAGRSHVVAAQALYDAFAKAADEDGGALTQKIVLGKLAAEFVSSCEDLGALVWAIRERREAGAFVAYLTYNTSSPGSMYAEIQRSMSVPRLLRVPDAEQIKEYVSDQDAVAYATGLDGLEARLREAAATYLDKSPKITQPYNKLKHGFVVVVRLDKLRDGSPTGDWKNDVNIITDITASNQIRYVVPPQSGTAGWVA